MVMYVQAFASGDARVGGVQHTKMVINSLKFSLAGNLLASAHNDKAVRVWDPRTKGSVAPAPCACVRVCV